MKLTKLALILAVSMIAIGLLSKVTPTAHATSSTSQSPGFVCIPFVTCPLSSPELNPQGFPGSWTYGSYKNSYGSRDYYLYLPKKSAGKPLPLMVMLHGCTQSATQFALETGMNWTAEKYGFAVLYPEQGYADNIWKCWNWFKPENQSRNRGEPSIVLGMMNEVSKHVPIDTHHVYIAGISSGAAMAANMLACHSDIFAGAGIASGLQFEAAMSEAEGHDVMVKGSPRDPRQTAGMAVKCTGPGAKMAAVIAIYGTSDTTVNPINTTQVIEQFSAMNDLLDDGQLNLSQNDRVIAAREDQVPNGYHYRTELYGGMGAVHLAKVSVGGMAHAWSGALSPGQFADMSGPNASEMIWLFLSHYGAR